MKKIIYLMIFIIGLFLMYYFTKFDDSKNYKSEKIGNVIEIGDHD